jgi:GAF domain-containing protein
MSRSVRRVDVPVPGAGDAVFHDRALEAVRLFGDAAVAMRGVPEERRLLVVAACHRNPAHNEAAKAIVGELWDFGDALPGRVWESERGILIPEADRNALESILRGAARAYVQAVGVSSIMIVPLWVGGRVVGTLGVSRDPGNPPYQEQDFDLFGRLADLSRGAT